MPSSTPPLPRPSATRYTATSATKALRRAAVLAACADVLLILVFAAVGRDAHQRGEIITGVLATAWPFLAGAAVSWLALRLWRAPLAVWPAGVGVWLGAVSIGMLLRALTGQTVVLPFVLVALLSLATLLLGYRLLAAGVRRFRARRRQQR
jgi:peptidoglycan/LPS O-acetylase OafA/YrhL